MRPYFVKEINGEETRILWPQDKSDLVLNRFKKEALSELRAIECEKARTMGIEGCIRLMDDGDLSVVPAELIEEEDGKGAYQINPVAVTIKHSGAELIDLTRDKYAVFCSEPQNPGMVEDVPLYAKKAGVKSRTAAAIGPITETPMTEDEPKKRGPGRPRKSDKL